GPERQGKNFAYQLARALSEGRKLPCPSDQWANPSYGPDVARAVVGLVEADCSGLIHVSGPEFLVRSEFARRLAEAFGLDSGLIEAKPSAEIGSGAPRPLRGGLQIPRLNGILPGVMRPLDQTLPDFLAQQETLKGWVKPIWRA